MLWGRQVAGRNYPPTNKNTLIRALTEEWDKLPQQLLDNVVQIMMILKIGEEGNSTAHNSPPNRGHGHRKVMVTNLCLLFLSRHGFELSLNNFHVEDLLFI
ncbi:hypothetical protein TNCV_548251 [Trichonephila clavipes]|nr:hypothetical protein TNCV_548251 [Trichonephila clavipes]